MPPLSLNPQNQPTEQGSPSFSAFAHFTPNIPTFRSGKDVAPPPFPIHPRIAAITRQKTGIVTPPKKTFKESADKPLTPAGKIFKELGMIRDPILKVEKQYDESIRKREFELARLQRENDQLLELQNREAETEASNFIDTTKEGQEILKGVKGSMGLLADEQVRRLAIDLAKGRMHSRERRKQSRSEKRIFSPISKRVKTATKSKILTRRHSSKLGEPTQAEIRERKQLLERGAREAKPIKPESPNRSI